MNLRKYMPPFRAVEQIETSCVVDEFRTVVVWAEDLETAEMAAQAFNQLYAGKDSAKSDNTFPPRVS